MKLTPEQLKAFDEQGYVFLPNCFSEEEIALLRIEAESILKADRQEVWREKTGAPRTAFAAHTFNEVFRLLAQPSAAGRAAEAVFGEDVYVHQFKLNAKAAFEGDVWQWHQDYGTWARDDGMPQAARHEHRGVPRRGDADQRPADADPESHKQGVLEAGHDKLTTSYPLWTLDKETVTRLCAEAAPPRRHRHRRADRQARLGADVPRQSGARLAAEHHALPAQDRLSDVLRLSPTTSPNSPGRNGSRTATSRRSCRWTTTRCWHMRAPIASRRNDGKMIFCIRTFAAAEISCSTC